MKIFPQPAVFSPVFIALTGFSAFLKMFLVFFLPDIYCKLNLSPEWPSRNFHCVPVFLVKCCCVCKLEFLSENLLLRKKKKKRPGAVQKTWPMCGNGVWMDVNFSVNSSSKRQGPHFRNYIPLPKNLWYDNRILQSSFLLSNVLLFKQVLGY